MQCCLKGPPKRIESESPRHPVRASPPGNHMKPPDPRVRLRAPRSVRPRPHHHSRGQALVELAIILPVMLLLAVAAIDLGRLFYAQITVENAAREGALTAAVLADDPDAFQGGTAATPTRTR